MANLKTPVALNSTDFLPDFERLGAKIDCNQVFRRVEEASEGITTDLKLEQRSFTISDRAIILFNLMAINRDAAKIIR